MPRGGNQVPIRSLSDRFWEKVDRSCGRDACWPWTAYRDADGYGRIRVGKTQRPTNAVAKELVSGEAADGRFACHSCDYPACCNPAHIFWGTMQDNRADCIQKGRHSRGSRHGSAKLTEEIVREIRRRYKYRDRVDGALAMAREFGVTSHVVDLIVHRRAWTHVED